MQKKKKRKEKKKNFGTADDVRQKDTQARKQLRLYFETVGGEEMLEKRREEKRAMRKEDVKRS